MYIMKIGINHQKTPIEIREKLTVSEDQAEDAMRYLSEFPSVIENVILSTCNRTEVYTIVEDLDEGKLCVIRFLSNWFQLESSVFKPYLEVITGEEAITHLYYVTSGLHSMVLGETQILGQVREAFMIAQENNLTGEIFNELFKKVITFAKRAHQKTGIGSQSVSVSYAAVKLLEQSIDSIADRHVVIIGAGEMSELALRNFLSLGVSQITIVNRTLSRAQELANQFQVEAKKLEDLPTVLKDADIVFTSVGSNRPILTKDDLREIQGTRQYQALYLIDIGVPRNLESSILNVENVTLYDIDDLKNIIDQNLEEKEQAANVIENMIDEEVRAFNSWLVMLQSIPAIAGLYQKGITIQEKVFESLLRKMPDLETREKQILHNHVQSVVNQLLREPIRQAKQMSQEKESTELLNQFIDIFGLDESLKSKISNKIEQSHTLMEVK